MTAFNTTGANCTGACTKPGGFCPCSVKPFGVDYSPPAPFIPANHTTIGTCSLCRGPVTVPTVWFGIIPPTPTCASCGAVAKPDYGPVIPMENPTL